MARKNRITRRARGGLGSSRRPPLTVKQPTSDLLAGPEEKTPFWLVGPVDLSWRTSNASDPLNPSGLTLSGQTMADWRSVYRTPLFDLRGDLKNISGLEAEAVVLTPKTKKGSPFFTLSLTVTLRFFNSGTADYFNSPSKYRIYAQEFGAIYDPTKADPLSDLYEISSGLYSAKRKNSTVLSQPSDEEYSVTLSWSNTPRMRFWGVTLVIDLADAAFSPNVPPAKPPSRFSVAASVL